MSLCSREVCDLSARLQTLTAALATQMMVESLSRPSSPVPDQKMSEPVVTALQNIVYGSSDSSTPAPLIRPPERSDTPEVSGLTGKPRCIRGLTPEPRPPTPGQVVVYPPELPPEMSRPGSRFEPAPSPDPEWQSLLVSALTTAPNRPYSPFVTSETKTSAIPPSSCGSKIGCDKPCSEPCGKSSGQTVRSSSSAPCSSQGPDFLNVGSCGNRGSSCQLVEVEDSAKILESVSGRAERMRENSAFMSQEQHSASSRVVQAAVSARSLESRTPQLVVTQDSATRSFDPLQGPIIYRATASPIHMRTFDTELSSEQTVEESKMAAERTVFGLDRAETTVLTKEVTTSHSSPGREFHLCCDQNKSHQSNALQNQCGLTCCGDSCASRSGQPQFCHNQCGRSACNQNQSCVNQCGRNQCCQSASRAAQCGRCCQDQNPNHPCSVQTCCHQPCARSCCTYSKLPSCSRAPTPCCQPAPCCSQANSCCGHRGLTSPPKSQLPMSHQTCAQSDVKQARSSNSVQSEATASVLPSRVMEEPQPAPVISRRVSEPATHWPAPSAPEARDVALPAVTECKASPPPQPKPPGQPQFQPQPQLQPPVFFEDDEPYMPRPPSLQPPEPRPKRSVSPISAAKRCVSPFLADIAVTAIRSHSPVPARDDTPPPPPRQSSRSTAAHMPPPPPPPMPHPLYNTRPPSTEGQRRLEQHKKLQEKINKSPWSPPKRSFPKSEDPEPPLEQSAWTPPGRKMFEKQQQFEQHQQTAPAFKPSQFNRSQKQPEPNTQTAPVGETSKGRAPVQEQVRQVLAPKQQERLQPSRVTMKCQSWEELEEEAEEGGFADVDTIIVCVSPTIVDGRGENLEDIASQALSMLRTATVHEGFESRIMPTSTTQRAPLTSLPHFRGAGDKKPKPGIATALATAPLRPYSPLPTQSAIMRTEPVPLPPETTPWEPPPRGGSPGGGRSPRAVSPFEGAKRCVSPFLRDIAVEAIRSRSPRSQSDDRSRSAEREREKREEERHRRENEERRELEAREKNQRYEEHRKKQEQEQRRIQEERDRKLREKQEHERRQEQEARQREGDERRREEQARRSEEERQQREDTERRRQDQVQEESIKSKNGEHLSMKEALTIAPERPYSPFVILPPPVQFTPRCTAETAPCQPIPIQTFANPVPAPPGDGTGPQRGAQRGPQFSPVDMPKLLKIPHESYSAFRPFPPSRTVECETTEMSMQATTSTTTEMQSTTIERLERRAHSPMRRDFPMYVPPSSPMPMCEMPTCAQSPLPHQEAKKNPLAERPLRSPIAPRYQLQQQQQQNQQSHQQQHHQEQYSDAPSRSACSPVSPACHGRAAPPPSPRTPQPTGVRRTPPPSPRSVGATRPTPTPTGHASPFGRASTVFGHQGLRPAPPAFSHERRGPASDPEPPGRRPQSSIPKQIGQHLPHKPSPLCTPPPTCTLAEPETPPPAACPPAPAPAAAQARCPAPPQSPARPPVPSDLHPGCSLPDAGGPGGVSKGGAFAGASAPIRGRGILNPAAVGSRIPLCGACNQHIRGPFITALGKIWCPHHFVCTNARCGRPLQDIGFVEEKGQLYCEYCFEQFIAPPCNKCAHKIKGDCLNAIGKHFHPECFNCVYCGKLFGNSPFFLEDGQPYCENDWNELFTTKCFACGFPIEAGDRWVEALSNNYHSQCFNCSMCKKNLEGQSFYAKGGRPFCKTHAR